MPPADVAVAVLRRATAPWRRWVDDRSGSLGRRPVHPDRVTRASASGDRLRAARAAPTGVETCHRAHDRADQDGGPGTHRGERAGRSSPRRRWRERLMAGTNRAAGRAAYLAAMLCPMGPYGSGSSAGASAHRASRAVAGPSPVRGCPAPRPGRSRGPRPRGRGAARRERAPGAPPGGPPGSRRPHG